MIGQTHKLNNPTFLAGVSKLYKSGVLTQHSDSSFILPWNGGKRDYLDIVRAEVPANLLYDVSGGKGILAGAKQWPIADFGYMGYAGGLSPDNLSDTLDHLSSVAGDQTVWIDVESGVRSDGKLDIEKVRNFLEIAEKFLG